MLVSYTASPFGPWQTKESHCLFFLPTLAETGTTSPSARLKNPSSSLPGLGHWRKNATALDFVGFTGDCGDACQDLVVSSTLNTPTFANNLNFYDVVTLDADDARCQPTPAPVPAPHHSDGATALAAGLAVPALAALAL